MLSFECLVEFTLVNAFCSDTVWKILTFFVVKWHNLELSEKRETIHIGPLTNLQAVLKLIIDTEWPSLWWLVPFLGRGPGICKKAG